MDKNIISVTDKALEQINKIWDVENPNNEKGLRISVTGGGCSGLSYKIEFSTKKEKDNIINLAKIYIIIDPKSSIYLKDVTLDYSEGLNGKGFVFENPNSKNTCGCGESFSI
jgi:iron-sulfur cluster assembly protein